MDKHYWSLVVPPSPSLPKQNNLFDGERNWPTKGVFNFSWLLIQGRITHKIPIFASVVPKIDSWLHHFVREPFPLNSFLQIQNNCFPPVFVSFSFPAKIKFISRHRKYCEKEITHMVQGRALIVYGSPTERSGSPKLFGFLFQNDHVPRLSFSRFFQNLS